MNCEVCGSNIRGEPQVVNLDGGVFRVCNSCSRLGTPARVQKPFGSRGGGFSGGYSGGGYSPGGQRPGGSASSARPPTSPPPPPSPVFAYQDENLVLREDYSKVIKNARELLGITQEELGHKINEKPSVISHLETGRMKPDDALARKLEHFLKIQLFIPEEQEEGESGSAPPGVS
ncbi:MAG TPA: multiprotein bridging factor aMBF1 [Nitrososphaerales archaeon]|nr:multiprotein bridging factor aMBF1 [Nitrososphaerales archaeon]